MIFNAFLSQVQQTWSNDQKVKLKQTAIMQVPKNRKINSTLTSCNDR